MDIKIGDKVIHEGGSNFEIVDLPGTSKLFPDYYRGMKDSGAIGLFPFEEIVSVNGVGIGILARAEARIAELENGLKAIGQLSVPGQELDIDDCIGVLAEVYQASAALLKEDNQ